ncbi:uncharacterized exonuclease domain-containing protein At3g15140 [Durio zibethinus]|uniref:Uncharacterized exonuclease domain-containing protein At3g15140 n=1 Tax=Durio zibethinus TaxID=66656 RepID=A0A6P5WQF7_DURZI|nr:uncharacterized exonuclease domain-containing protein At3g15140 [Durio zibethinus]
MHLSYPFILKILENLSRGAELKPFSTAAFMNSTRFPVSRIFSLFSRSLSPPIINLLFNSTLPHVPSCKFSIIAQFSSSSSSLPPPSPLYAAMETQVGSSSSSRWRPMCLYYTQGKCTQMDDSIHLEKFNHDCSRDLQVNATDSDKKCSQDVDFLLVLDLEGKVEILEFPVLLMDAKSLGLVDFFHRFVRPSKMSEQAINKYIEGKYGEIGVDRVWHDTALPFMEVIQQFEAWLTQHNLWKKEEGGCLACAAFVTCGNWDLKTKIPQQCIVSGIKLPPYFMEWINLKDVYLNFYGREARGMMSMMKQLEIPALGSHHLGIDDSKNIARVLQHMLADGALMQITARRHPESQKVEFHYENRIRAPQRRERRL